MDGKTILEEIGEAIAKAPTPPNAVMLPKERWSALCAEAGIDPDTVLTQQHVDRDGKDHRVLIMPQGPIG